MDLKKAIVVLGSRVRGYPWHIRKTCHDGCDTKGDERIVNKCWWVMVIEPLKHILWVMSFQERAFLMSLHCSTVELSTGIHIF
jgi:hypothetical protein